MALSLIDALPNEILIEILGTFSTHSLLPLATICHRFHSLVSRIHYARLVVAAALKDHELILEVYHPSAKISTPYLFCHYHGTDGILDAGVNPTLRELNGLYSRFRPVIGDENRRPRARYPTTSVIAGVEEPLVDLASHQVQLDSCELFSQLCFVANLVKVGPKRGLFSSCVNLTESVIRVWRDWLASEVEKAKTLANGQQRGSLNLSESSIIWADSSMNVGLKVWVVEKVNDRTPVFYRPGDEPPLTYELQYEELLIRTNQLLHNIEKSEAQMVMHSGNAIVIASM